MVSKNAFSVAALFQLLPLHLFVFVLMVLARDEPELQDLDPDLNSPESLGVFGSGSLAWPHCKGEQLHSLDVVQVLLGLLQTPSEKMRGLSAQITVILGRA